MAKRNTLGKTADAVRTVASKALGAAAAAATAALVDSVADAITKGGDRLTKAGQSLQDSAAKAVEGPIVPNIKKKSAAVKKRKVAKTKSKRPSRGSRKKHG